MQRKMLIGRGIIEEKVIKNLKGKRKMKKDIYKENGYKSRADYLLNLSKNYGVDILKVSLLAHIFGLNEDFDGLVNALEEIMFED